MKNKVKKIAIGSATLVAGASSVLAANPAVQAISDEAALLTTDATPVIVGGLGIGLIFFGARRLFRAFKSMT